MNTLISIIIATAHLVAFSVGYRPEPVAIPAPPAPIEQRFGAAPSPIAGSVYTLAGSGVSSSATTVTLSSLTIKQTGQQILTGDLRQGASDKFYVTLEPGSNSRQEIVGCSAVTQNSGGTATLTGCSRGLAPVYPYSASTTLSFSHGGGTQAVFGDAPQLFNDFKAYVDTAVVSGAVDSSLTAKGVIEKAAASEAAAHAAVGSGNTTAPLALTTDIASSTRTANAPQVVVASSTDGYIDSSYIKPFATTTYLGGFPAYQIGTNRQIFTALGTSTFTVPSGITIVRVQMVGGGGGGGGSNSATACSGGGGGGAYYEGFINLTGTSSVLVTVGGGGAGGASTASGSNGGNTYFGVNGYFATSTGGTGGTGSGTKTGGAGGATTTPNLLATGILGIPGGYGLDGISATGLSLPNGQCTAGGTSFYGGGGSTDNTIPPSIYGVGGAGAANSTGRPGGPGVIIVTW